MAKTCCLYCGKNIYLYRILPHANKCSLDLRIGLVCVINERGFFGGRRGNVHSGLGLQVVWP